MNLLSAEDLSLAVWEGLGYGPSSRWRTADMHRKCRDMAELIRREFPGWLHQMALRELQLETKYPMYRLLPSGEVEIVTRPETATEAWLRIAAELDRSRLRVQEVKYTGTPPYREGPRCPYCDSADLEQTLIGHPHPPLSPKDPNHWKCLSCGWERKGR